MIRFALKNMAVKKAQLLLVLLSNAAVRKINPENSLF